MNEEYYYISAGSKTMMYTLRHVYYETVRTVEGNVIVERDRYCYNLSTNWDKAVVKARQWAKDKLSLKHSFSLEDIKRRSAEEIEAALKVKEAQDELYEMERQSRYRDQELEIAKGYWPFGKHSGEKFTETPNTYIVSMANMPLEIYPNKPQYSQVMLFLQKTLIEKFPDLFSLPTPNGEYFGELKQRTSFTVLVIEEFSFDGYYGTTYVLKMVKDTGELLVYMGSAPPDAEVGQQYTFTATIKCHEKYKGEKQTKIQRITKWEEVNNGS